MALENRSKTANRPIFRDEAFQHYIERQDQTALPRFDSPRIFACLWALLALLLGSSVLAWFGEVPVYASGSAVVAIWNVKGQGSDQIAIVTFFPPEFLPRLQVGQMMSLEFDSSHQLISYPSPKWSRKSSAPPQSGDALTSAA